MTRFAFFFSRQRNSLLIARSNRENCFAILEYCVSRLDLAISSVFLRP